MSGPRVLTINVGNTHSSAVAWTEFTPQAGIGAWKTGAAAPVSLIRRAQPGVIILSGVVPAYKKKLAASLERIADVRVFRKDIPAPLTIVPRPADKVGDDRIAAALGALMYDWECPWVVVDLGTATTVNAVRPGSGKKLPRFEGGLIFPGTAMCFDALHQRTAQLPKLGGGVIKLSSYIGTTTAEAMQLGVHHSLIGGICSCIYGQLKELGADACIALTGGGLTERVRQAIEQTFDERVRAGMLRANPWLVHVGLRAAWAEFLQNGGR
ncbi:MAG TPA: type III pantothenate kinase [Planctomycetota bacterium]|nr:type III pantothenate kinase [Planctomycetota bacterium]